MARRNTTTKPQIDLTPYTGLLAKLDALAAQPDAACPICKKTEAHVRCNGCGNCHPEGTTLCGDCGASNNNYRKPLRRWTAQQPYSAGVGADMAARIRDGKPPTSGQVALAEKLYAEMGRTVTTEERDAIDCLGPRSKAWSPVLALLEARAFVFVREDMRSGSRWFGQDTPYNRDDVALVRAKLREVMYDAAGYERFLSAADFIDASKVIPKMKGKRGIVSADPVLDRAIDALLETHTWLVREQRIIEVVA